MMEVFKRSLRRSLQWLLPHWRLPGKFWIADVLGARIAPVPPEELLPIGGINVRIDHRLVPCRHMYYGIYEQDFVRFLQRTLQRGDAFIDLGANIGYMTAIAHQLVGEEGVVLAFEPSRTCQDQLRTDNPVLPKGVHLSAAAIMDHGGRFPFLETPQVISHGFSCLFHDRKAAAGDQVYEVQAVTLDEVVEQERLTRIACVKVDIEGAEHIALLGAQNLLRTGAVDHWLVETTNLRPVSRAVNEKVIALLTSHGYRSFLPDRRGTLHPYHIDLSTTFRHDIIWRRGS